MLGAATIQSGTAAHDYVECTTCVVRRGQEHCAVCHLPPAMHAFREVRFVERRQLARAVGYDSEGRVYRCVLWAAGEGA